MMEEKQMKVIDTADCNAHEASVEDVKYVHGIPVYLVAMVNVGRFLVVEYPDGTQYTQKDWQSGCDAIPDDLAGVQWIRQDGVQGIVIDNLPRNF